MTAYEQQVINAERFYDKAMNLAESEAQEILPSYVPADRVHEKINNPTEEGIDEG